MSEPTLFHYGYFNTTTRATGFRKERSVETGKWSILATFTDHSDRLVWDDIWHEDLADRCVAMHEVIDSIVEHNGGNQNYMKAAWGMIEADYNLQRSDGRVISGMGLEETRAYHRALINASVRKTAMDRFGDVMAPRTSIRMFIVKREKSGNSIYALLDDKEVGRCATFPTGDEVALQSALAEYERVCNSSQLPLSVDFGHRAALTAAQRKRCEEIDQFGHTTQTVSPAQAAEERSKAQRLNAEAAARLVNEVDIADFDKARNLAKEGGTPDEIAAMVAELQERVAAPAAPADADSDDESDDEDEDADVDDKKVSPAGSDLGKLSESMLILASAEQSDDGDEDDSDAEIIGEIVATEADEE